MLGSIRDCQSMRKRIGTGARSLSFANSHQPCQKSAESLELRPVGVCSSDRLTDWPVRTPVRDNVGQPKRETGQKIRRRRRGEPGEQPPPIFLCGLCVCVRSALFPQPPAVNLFPPAATSRAPQPTSGSSPWTLLPYCCIAHFFSGYDSLCGRAVPYPTSFDLRRSVRSSIRSHLNHFHVAGHQP